MNKRSTISGVVSCGALLAGPLAPAAVLVDPGFEDPLVSDGSGVGKWEPFSNGGANAAFIATDNPRNGASNMRLELVDPNSFAGAFQDVPVSPGGTIIFSGWHALANGNVGGTEVRIEFRNAGGEVGRTGNLVPPISAGYSEFSLSDTVPGGADIARLVYAIQSFGAPAPQLVDVDDMSVSGTGVIPEPGTALLSALSLLALAVRRRR